MYVSRISTMLQLFHIKPSGDSGINFLALQENGTLVQYLSTGIFFLAIVFASGNLLTPEVVQRRNRSNMLAFHHRNCLTPV